MEIKVGDRVRVREDAPRLYTDGWSCNWLDCDVYVTKIDGDAAEVKKICDDDEWYYLNIPLKYLTKVEVEAKESKFKVGDKVRVLHSEILRGVYTIIGANCLERLGWYYQLNIHEWYPSIDLEPYTEPTEESEPKDLTKETADNLSTMLERYANAMETIKTDSYWDAYTADLAKEVALKVTNKFNAPHEVADYAVKVAKAVVEGLKRK